VPRARSSCGIADEFRSAGDPSTAVWLGVRQAKSSHRMTK
jgi:hypothetical protein